MRPELAQYEGRYPRLFDDMRLDWSQLERANAIRGALDLTEATGGEPFRADAPPQYFTGDLDARFVLVQLNPKRHDQRWARQLTDSSFEEWVLAQRSTHRNRSFERLLAARLVERQDHETCLTERDGTVMRDRSRPIP